LIFFAPYVCEAAPAPKRVVVLDIRVMNDIGVENADAIVTSWLVDSISRVAPNVRVIPGARAARLARLRLPAGAEDITPRAAVTLMKSIDSTHLLGGEIFLWENKYGVTLRLIRLPDTGRARVERAWADSVDSIPEKIEELAAALFAPGENKKARLNPPAKARPAKAAPEKRAPAKKNLSSRARALLGKHPEMVYVPDGEFQMGNDNDSDADNMPLDPLRREGVSRLALLAAEKPRHTRKVKAFLIDKYEVTNSEYKKFRSSHEFPFEKADHPVTGIGWHDAVAYAEWAGKRLPTEPEWEKAARGADGRKWPWGDIFERDRCNLGSDTAPVGGFPGDKSPYGVYDMAGNAQEWTASPFVAYPGASPENVAFDSAKKVVRGSYYGGNDFLARCSMRFCALPGEPGKKPEGLNYAYIGFRCVMDID
jgi:iron(II)-dependent oxidoreductase